MDISYVFLPIIVLFGIIISFEDIREGKIRNKWIILMTLIAIFLWFLFYFLKIVSLKYLILIFSYSLAALILGFFIWLIGWWSAGDAKLYFAFNLLVPLSKYQPGDFPTIVIFINSILPIFLFLVIKMLMKSSRKQKINALKGVFEIKRLENLLLIVFALAWVSQGLFLFIGINANYIFNIIAIFGLIQLLERLVAFDFLKKLKIKSNHLLMGIGVLRILFEYKLMLTIQFWIGFIILTMGYAIIRMFILDLGGVFSKNVMINELKEGMILSGISAKKRKKTGIGGSGSFLNYYCNYKEGRGEFADGILTNKDIKKIKFALKKHKPKFKSVKVHETIPFAPFIFLGVLLTFFLQGGIISFLIHLFS